MSGKRNNITRKNSITSKSGTVKMNKTGQLFRIDSRSRTSGTTSDFMIAAQTDMKFKTATLLSVEIPNGIYPISSARETDYLRVNQNGVIIDVTLTEGNYTSEEFRVELETQLNAAVNSNGSYTVTYDTKTGKYTITNIVVISLELTASGYIYIPLGFSYANTPLLLSHTSDNIIDLSGVPYLTFDINPLPSSRRLITGNGSTGLFTIPMRAPFGTVNYFEASGLGYELINQTGTKHTLGNVRITITDEHGRIVDLKIDWSMLLHLE